MESPVDVQNNPWEGFPHELQGEIDQARRSISEVYGSFIANRTCPFRGKVLSFPGRVTKKSGSAHTPAWPSPALTRSTKPSRVAEAWRMDV